MLTHAGLPTPRLENGFVAPNGGRVIVLHDGLGTFARCVNLIARRNIGQVEVEGTTRGRNHILNRESEVRRRQHVSEQDNLGILLITVRQPIDVRLQPIRSQQVNITQLPRCLRVRILLNRMTFIVSDGFLRRSRLVAQNMWTHATCKSLSEDRSTLRSLRPSGGIRKNVKSL